MYTYNCLLGLSGSGGGLFVEVVEHRLHEILRMLLETVYVDETWYIENYQDVAGAIQEGILSSAREHYINVGYFEDRMPHYIVVDAEWYLKTNPDVAEGIRQRTIKSADEHFQMAGFKEGRLPYAGWSLAKST
jgi:hypothetical protein